MEAVFLKLLNMSLTACVLIVAVLIARMLLKKAPRWSICLLWGLVALRLICPFTIKSNLSLIHNSEPITREIISEQLPTAPVDTEPVHHEIPDSVPETQEIPQQTVEVVPERQAPSILAIAGYVWLSGMTLMLIYFLISYLMLKHRVCTATRLEKNIRQSEYVSSPFVLGVFRPVIYLPYGLKQSHQDHIIAHERSHICRGDHLIKPLGFAILSVHWFNPFVWIAYILLCRDIEAACDERVIKAMTKEQRQYYSATLLHYSVKHRRIAACPVAFGETGIKGRIKNVMNYKKPAVWLIILSVLLSLLLAGCFLTDPVEEQPEEQLSVSQEDQERIDSLVNQIYTKLWDDGFDSLHPDYYRLIDAEARQELMAYGDTALEYLVSQLRTTSSSNHSVRERIMVYLCEDLAKAIPAESRYSGQWPDIPGVWLTYYDLKNADQDDHSAMKPGFYQAVDVLYGDLVDENTVYWDYGRRYMVTEKGFFIRNTRASYGMITSISDANGETVYLGEKEDGGIRIRHSYDEYTTVIQIDWNWQASGGKDDLWSKLRSQERDEWKEHSMLAALLEEKDYLYQSLDENHCLIQTGTGLYTDWYIIGQVDGKLQYVYEIDKVT